MFFYYNNIVFFLMQLKMSTNFGAFPKLYPTRFIPDIFSIFFDK